MNRQRKRLQPGRTNRLVSLCLVLLLGLGVWAWPLRLAAEGGDSSGLSRAEDSAEGENAGEEGEAPEEEGEGEEEPQRELEGLYAPEDWEPAAEAVCLMNVETGLAVYEKNADAPMTAASLVKMMTCILTMEFVEKFDRDIDTDMVTSAEKTWIYDQLYGKNASTADIRKGESLSVRELLYATLLPSANEGALLLADYVATGYMTNFLYQMNTRAKSLGCTGTHFADPNGLSEENMTTARDMALITREFMKYPTLVEIAAADQYEMQQHELHNAPYNIFNTNRLMAKTSPYYKKFSDVTPYLQAGKTGSLGEWQNFASQASREGETYVCVVLHSPNEADTIGAELDPQQFRPALVESGLLYRWAFEKLTVTSALDTTQPVKELRVRYSTDADTVLLLPQDDIKAVLEVGGDPTVLRKSYDLPDSVAAPVKAGTVVGSVTVSIGSTPIGSSRLSTAQDISRNPTLAALTKGQEFFTGLYFRVLLVLLLIFAAGYVGLMALANYSRQKRKTAPAAGRQPAKAAAKKAAGRKKKTVPKTGGKSRQR